MGSETLDSETPGSETQRSETPGSVTPSGSIRTYLINTKYPDGGDRAQGIAMLRLKLSGDITSQTRFELAYEATPTWSDTSLGLGDGQGSALQGGASYRASDLDRLLYPSRLETEDRFMVTQNLDRAFISLAEENFDLIMGRQPVSFGSAHVINPTDVLAPFTYETIAKEEKTGIDALRMRVPTGDFSEIDMALVLGDRAKRDESAAYVRVKSYVFETDIAFMLMLYGGNKMMGIDLARAIGDASAWMEATYTRPSKEVYYTDSSSYTRLSIGADRAFSGTVYGYVEYHFNGPGADKPEDYVLNVLNAAYLEGSVYLLGKNYLAPGLTVEITPLLSAGGTALVNLDDNSALLAPSLTYSVSDNATASAGAYLGTGEEPGPAGPRTEFGSYPDTYYLSFKYYF